MNPQTLLEHARSAYRSKQHAAAQEEATDQIERIGMNGQLFREMLKQRLDLDADQIETLIAFDDVTPYIDLEDVRLWLYPSSALHGWLLADKRCGCGAYNRDPELSTDIKSWEDLGKVVGQAAPRCFTCSRPKHIRSYSQVRFFIDARTGATELQDRINTWLHIGCPDAHPSIATHVTPDHLFVAVTFRAEEEVSHVKR